MWNIDTHPIVFELCMMKKKEEEEERSAKVRFSCSIFSTLRNIRRTLEAVFTIE